MEDEVPTDYPSENLRLDAMHLHVLEPIPGDTFRASSTTDTSTAFATDQGKRDNLGPPRVTTEPPPLLTADIDDCSGINHATEFDKRQPHA